MKKRWIFLSVIAATAAGVALIATHINWENYRPQLAAQISDALGADVHLNGKLSITLFPYPKLAADDAELSAPGVDIRTPSLRLAAKLWPLLRGRVVLSSAEIDAPDIHLTPELWKTSTMGAPDADTTGRMNVQLADVEMDDGQVEITTGGHTETLEEFGATLRAPDWQGPYHAEGDFTWQGQSWDFETLLGVMTAANSRPFNFSITQSDTGAGLKWQGALAPAPFALHGDGVWQSDEGKKLTLVGMMNWVTGMIEINKASFASPDKSYGTLNGRFDIAQDNWAELTGDLQDVPMTALSYAPFATEGLEAFGDQDMQRAAFKWQRDHWEELQLLTKQTQINAEADVWRVSGRNAADVLAHATDSDRGDWPRALAAPFLLRFKTLPDQIQIQDATLGETHVHGDIKDRRMTLEADKVSWPQWMGSAPLWHKYLDQNHLQSVRIHAAQWDAAPFAHGEAMGNFVLTDGADLMEFHAGPYAMTGAWHGEKFSGQLACKPKPPEISWLRPGCAPAEVTGDNGTFHFQSPDFTGAFDFDAGQWQIALPFASGTVATQGDIGSPKFKVRLNDLLINEVMTALVPATPLADGKISGDLSLQDETADGAITAAHVQWHDAGPTGLNGPAQAKTGGAMPAKFGSVTAKLHWHGDELTLTDLHTTEPEGRGHIDINLHDKTWHGEWQGMGGVPYVLLEGPIAPPPPEINAPVGAQKALHEPF